MIPTTDIAKRETVPMSRPIRTVLLTQEADCLGLEEAELIVDASLSDDAADAMIQLHINTVVLIMNDDRVYSSSGVYLGDLYI